MLYPGFAFMNGQFSDDLVDQFHAHFDHGWEAMFAGRYEEAQKSADEAHSLDPENARVFVLFGQIAEGLGDDDDAMRHYNTALAMDEECVEAIVYKAQLLMNVFDDPEAALEHLDECEPNIQDTVLVSDIKLQRAEAKMILGQDEEAISVLQSIDGGVELPYHVDMMMGDLKLRLGLAREALVHYKRSARRNENPDIMYMVAKAKETVGKEDRKTDEGKTLLSDAAEMYLNMRSKWLKESGTGPWGVQDFMHMLDAHLHMTEHLGDLKVFYTDMPGAEAILDGVDPKALLSVRQKGHTLFIIVYSRQMEQIPEEEQHEVLSVELVYELSRIQPSVMRKKRVKEFLEERGLDAKARPTWYAHAIKEKA